MDCLFSCETMKNLNGFQLKATEPDSTGCYPCVVGCLGVPTRNDVIYDTQSVIDAMKDTSSRFNICLRDGNLAGEYGHPYLEGESNQDKAINRLLHIEEKCVSHYFKKIWVDTEPISIKGMEALAIRALIKPHGPYRDSLIASFRDPDINTSFSIRSLCARSNGPDKRYEYRSVQILVTFDHAHAPGFDITSKRYNSIPGAESFTVGVSRDALSRAINMHTGCESTPMITTNDLIKIFPMNTYGINKLYMSNPSHTEVIRAGDGKHISAASLLYNRRNNV